MSDLITITPRFRRCPPSFQAAITFMAAHIADTEQGAFTWTGPYGGGKSSLALALACLFGAPKPNRDQAASLFGAAATNALREALTHFPGRWDVLPLVVERRSISAQIAERLELSADAKTIKRPRPPSHFG